MVTNPEDDGFEIIGSDEMETTPRGRKSQASPALVKALRDLRAGSALRLSSYSVPSKGDPKTVRKDRMRVSARIRSAAKAAEVSVLIRWSPAGIPQVTLAAK